MIFQDIKANLATASVLQHPAECLLFGFNLPLTGFDFAPGNICEPGWTGGTVARLKQSAPYAVSMKKATKVVFDNTSTAVSGILVMIKTDERIITTWDGVVGHTIRYDLPKNAILLRDTSGNLVHGAAGEDPATCAKKFIMGKARYTLPAGTAGDSHNVQDFESAGFLTRSMATGISRALLAQRGFITAGGKIAFRLAFIACGRGSATVQNLRPNSAAVTESSVNTLSITLDQPAPVDFKVIAEYSGPDNQWKPLAFVDTTDGFTKTGKIHFEPPGDWVETTRWDEQCDIGGGPHGTGPRSRWIRLQRRLANISITGAKLAGLTAQNLPYLSSTRQDNPISLPFTQKNVGQIVTFRFVPIAEDGKEQLDAALMFRMPSERWLAHEASSISRIN